MRSALIVTASLFVALVGLSGWRIVAKYQAPGPFDESRQGYCDFHNGVYYPSLAFTQGVSPYGARYVDSYPVERPIPFYSPLILACHAPWTWMPLGLAEKVYFAWSIALVVALAYGSVRWATRSPTVSDDQHGGNAEPQASCDVVAQGNANANANADASPCAQAPSDTQRWLLVGVVACGIVASRGGQQTLFTGYYTLELVLAALLAVQYARTRPLCSAVALAFTSAKPTYVLPLAGLMLFRGQWRVVALAALIAIAGAAASLAWMLQSQSLADIRNDITRSQSIHRNDAYELPSNSWTRVDALAIIAKWTGSVPGDVTHLAFMIVMLVPPAIALARLERRPNADIANRDSAHVTDLDGVASLGGSLLLASVLVSIYHQVYDVLLLTPAIVAIALANRQPWNRVSVPLRWALLVCMVLPSVNYFSSQMLLSHLHIESAARQIVTSLNALSLMIAAALLLAMSAAALRDPHESSEI